VGEGKSLTLFNLGYVCAQLGDNVLIVDSDLHRPRQHKMLGVSNSVGLATVLMGKADLQESIMQTEVPNLSFLPSGRMPSGSHGLLATKRMTDLVADVKEMYDLVLFDSPPIIGVSDASLLVREVEGVLLIIQHRKYPRAVSMRARDMIDNVGGNLIGVVLNNINISRDHTYYYYQQHYYYYPRRSREAAKAAQREEEAAAVEEAGA
jgi:capsular exopolysaccharide synthesis family protein